MIHELLAQALLVASLTTSPRSCDWIMTLVSLAIHVRIYPLSCNEGGLSNMLPSEKKDEVAGGTPKVHFLFKAIFRGSSWSFSRSSSTFKVWTRTTAPMRTSTVICWNRRSHPKRNIIFQSTSRRIPGERRNSSDFLSLRQRLSWKQNTYQLRYKQSSRHRADFSPVGQLTEAGIPWVRHLTQSFLSFFFLVFPLFSPTIYEIYFFLFIFFYPNSNPEVIKYLS